MTAMRIATTAACLLAALLVARPAAALDKVRVVDAPKGAWDTTLLVFAVEKGIFRDAGLEVEIAWSDGGSDALQAVIVGSADVAYQTATLGVVAAWERGAPLAILSAAATGAPDQLWVVRKDSPLKSIDDIAGATVAASRPGSPPHLAMTQLVAAKGVAATIVTNAAASAPLAAVLAGQADVGVTTPLAAAEALKRGDIRVLFTGNDMPGVADQTVRVVAANAAWVEKNTEVAKRFVAAFGAMLDWAYAGDEAVRMWADLGKLPPDQAREMRDAHYPRAMLSPGKIDGLDLTVTQAIAIRRMAKPLTDEQRRSLLRWVGALAP